MARRIIRAMGSRLMLIWLRLRNRFDRSQIIGPGGPVVSLTSYGKRVETVYLVIESIASGSLLPSRCILWLDEKPLVDSLPEELRRLQRRGLEIRLCQNYGPHTKYYPYLESSHKCEAPLVTADDDILYPKDWLKRLVGEYHQFPDVVNCHRARVIAMNHDGIAKYESWRHAESTDQSMAHFALGVGGVLYPPRLQERLKQEGNAFLSCCPKADDVWLHVQALRAGFKIRQIAPTAFRLVYIPGSQTLALNHKNLAGGENDRQIATTYRVSDIDRLRECQPDEMLKLTSTFS